MKSIFAIWRYLKHYKKGFFIAIFAMITVQFLSLLAPLMVKSILDDHLVSIQEPWYEVDQYYENSIFFNDKYFTQEIENEFVYTIVTINGKNYMIEGIVADGVRSFAHEQLVVNNGGNLEYYDVVPLGATYTQAFYQPVLKPITILLILLVVRYILQIVFLYIQRTATTMVMVSIVQDARLDASKALSRLPMDYFENEPAGKIASRIVTDVNGLINLFNILMNLMINATFAIVFAYIGMFYLNWQLALLSFIVFPIIYVWLKYFVKRLRDTAEKSNESRSLITAQLNEIINGVGVLQVFNYKDQTIQTFNEISRNYQVEQLKEQKLHLAIGWNLIRLLGALITAFIVLYFGYNEITVIGFTATAGLIYAYNDYLTRLIEPVMILFREIGNYQHALVRTKRILTLIDGKQEDDTNYMIPRYEGKIVFDNVWFSYHKNTPVLKGVHLDIKPGEMVGIVGHTGSGKSTLMNLLLRFYDMKDGDLGSIFIDDVNINTHPKRAYRQHIGIILQDPVMFKGTIADNIRFGSTASDEQIEDVLRRIGGSRLIDKFEHGIFQQIVRGGTNLSIGEKQIISFARVVLHNPAILIMDEATANIDTQTEKMIQDALELVKQNRTTIVIAHRLSTIKKANKIVVLDNGLKAEEGTHESLLKAKGIYAHMYRSQVSENLY